MGFLLQIRMSWLRALSKGCRCWCWCCGPGWLSAPLRRAAVLVGRWRRCRCCQLAKRTSAGVSWLCALWRCRKLAAQAAYILVLASRMSTGRGLLPSYLGLCWCNLVKLAENSTSCYNWLFILQLKQTAKRCFKVYSPKL